MSLINEYEFKKCVDRYKGDRHAIKFNCRDQFMVMSFAQFTDRAGLRDIETTLKPLRRPLSLRNQGNTSIHACGGQREEGLAYISRLCDDFDKGSHDALQG